MSAPQDHADRATALQRAGAAGLALECDTNPYGGGAGDYADGLEEVRESPGAALQNWLAAEGWAYPVPRAGYLVEREETGRVLLSYDVEDRTKVAFILASGVHDYRDVTGWGVESFGLCDPSELPPAVTDRLGIGVWQDRSGARVPVDRIQSFPGAEHCDWQDLTFLLWGSESDGEQFVRDLHGELTEWLTTTYDSDATLPSSATDTGLHHDGRRLWLADGPRAAYLVSLTDPDDVERWPAAVDGSIGCA